MDTLIDLHGSSACDHENGQSPDSSQLSPVLCWPTQCEAQVPDTMPPMTPRAARRWEELYGDDEVTSQKQRAQALYEVGGSKPGGCFLQRCG